MDDLAIRRADDIPLDLLAVAFNRAFEGYLVPIWHTPESIASMIGNNDVRLASSLVLEDEHGKLAGIALLGVRGERGWVAGMGVAPEWRGRRAGYELMTRLLAVARALGLRTIQLEVLDHNTPARRLYSQLGFQELRPLIVYTGVGTPPEEDAPAGIDAAPMSIAPLPLHEALADFDAMHHTAPPWQRERPSLLHMAPRLDGICIREGESVRAYLLSMPLPGGVSVLDCGSRSQTPDARAADALALLLHLIRHDPDALIRVINVPPGDPLDAALARLQCPIVATQHEMRLSL